MGTEPKGGKWGQSLRGERGTEPKGGFTIFCVVTGSQCKRTTNARIELGSILAFVVCLH